MHGLRAFLAPWNWYDCRIIRFAHFSGSVTTLHWRKQISMVIHLLHLGRGLERRDRTWSNLIDEFLIPVTAFWTATSLTRRSWGSKPSEPYEEHGSLGSYWWKYEWKFSSEFDGRGNYIAGKSRVPTCVQSSTDSKDWEQWHRIVQSQSVEP